MVLKTTIRLGFAIVLSGVSVRGVAAQPAASATADPVLAGYTRFYSGDLEGAYAHFEGLHARERESLAAWYGLLMKVVDDYEDQDAAGAARLGLLTPYRARPSTAGN